MPVVLSDGLTAVDYIPKELKKLPKNKCQGEMDCKASAWEIWHRYALNLDKSTTVVVWYGTSTYSVSKFSNTMNYRQFITSFTKLHQNHVYLQFLQRNVLCILLHMLRKLTHCNSYTETTQHAIHNMVFHKKSTGLYHQLLFTTTATRCLKAPRFGRPIWLSQSVNQPNLFVTITDKK